MTWFLSLLLLTTILWAQSSPPDKTEKKAIERAKAVLASSLDRSLPKITLDYWLQYESKGGAIHWEAHDCAGQTGNPAADRGRDFFICVEADFDVEHRTASVMVAVGTRGKGVTGTPELFSVSVTEADGAVHSIKHLGSLPAELHRARPVPRSPRDLEPQPTDKSYCFVGMNLRCTERVPRFGFDLLSFWQLIEPPTLSSDKRGPIRAVDAVLTLGAVECIRPTCSFA